MEQDQIIERVEQVVNALRAYHRHEVKGLEHIPPSGRVLLVVNHSLATYDIGLLFGAIHEEKGRLARPLADRLFFKIPYVKDLVHRTGVCEGSPENARSLLQAEELVAVAPGGMREALRPSAQRYQIMWEGRKGFVKLAIETQTPIIIAVCPKADDIFDVYPNKITEFAYQHFRIPLFLARGIGFSPLPRPVKLIHFLSEPIVPPVASKNQAALNRQTTILHKKVIKITQDLIGHAIAYRP